MVVVLAVIYCLIKLIFLSVKRFWFEWIRGSNNYEERCDCSQRRVLWITNVLSNVRGRMNSCASQRGIFCKSMCDSVACVGPSKYHFSSQNSFWNSSWMWLSILGCLRLNLFFFYKMSLKSKHLHVWFNLFINVYMQNCVWFLLH